MKLAPLVCAAAAVSFFGAAWAARAAETPAGPIKVGAIFAVTGGASNLGAPEKKTAEMIVARINAAGGVLGRPVELIVKDSEGATEKAASFARQLMDEDHVLAIIGPSTSGESLAIKKLCEEGKTILISCAAAEAIVEPVAPYVFQVAPQDKCAARWILQTLKERGIRRIGVVTSNDGFGKGGKEQLAKYAPEYGVEIAISEVYDKAATDLTGLLTKVQGRNVQAVVNWSAIPAQALVAKNMRQLGFDVPLFQSHGFANIRNVEAGGEAANGTIFPAGRLLVADLLPDGQPQKKLLLEYKREYESRYHDEVSTFGGHAYDALLLLTDAIRKAGSADPERVRDALENLRGVVGTAGIFNFSKQAHNGLDMNAFEMLTVKDGKFALYRKNE